MSDLFRSKENEFYIELSEERYYNPGDEVLGDVVLDLKKATKTNNIKLTLEGMVEFGGRSFVLFSKTALLAESPEGDHKSYYLRPHTHRFPFKINIPSSDGYQVPTTLEIPKLLKVSYRLVAIYNKAYTVLEKLCPTTSASINILENINVESPEYCGEQRLTKSLLLTGETSRKVKVSAVIGKKAAVRGDIIPISVTIEHIGVMVRDKAISAKLFRSVYYGRNKKELFGPKLLREVTSDIEISGPFNFTKTFNLRLPIPTHISPTVDRSGKIFKIQYFIRISVNLNEQNPHRAETENDIVVFSSIFTVGTYPKLSFCIDDDEEEDENSQKIDEGSAKNSSIDPSEYDQVFEKMKDLDFSEETDQTNESNINIEDGDNSTSCSSAKATNNACSDNASIDSTKDSHSSIQQPSKKPSVRKPDEVSSLTTTGSFYCPYTAEVISPPLDRLRYGTDSTSSASLRPQSSPEPGHLESISSPYSHNRSSSNVSGMSTTDSTPAYYNSSSTSPRPPFKQTLPPSVSLPDIPVTKRPISSSPLQRHESGTCTQPSVHSPKLSEQGSSHIEQHLARQESARWVVPNRITTTSTTSSVTDVSEPFQLSPRINESVHGEHKGGNVNIPMPMAYRTQSDHNLNQPAHEYYDNCPPPSTQQHANFHPPTPMPMHHSVSSPPPYNHSQTFHSPQIPSSPFLGYENNQQTNLNHHYYNHQGPNTFDHTENHGNGSIPQPQHYFPGGFLGMPTPQNQYPY